MKTTFKRTPTNEKKFWFYSQMNQAKRVRWAERRRFDSAAFFN